MGIKNDDRFLSREGFGKLVAWIVVINLFLGFVLLLFVLFWSFGWFCRRLRRRRGRCHRERTSRACNRSFSH